MSTGGAAAVLANEYVLAHKVSFNDKSYETRYQVSPHFPCFKAGTIGPGSSSFVAKSASASMGNSERVYFFFKKPGHIIADCHALSRKLLSQ